ncbi:methyltransferase, partial [Staphylococcus aureus]
KYLIDLHQHQNSSIEVLREFAEGNEVPIVDRLTLDLIKQLIRMNNVKNILEIGTAIGYSSMQFASISDDIHVTTIERNET